MVWAPFLAGQLATADALNDGAARTVDWAITTTNVGPISTTETVIVTSNTVTFRTGRGYRFFFRGLVQGSGTSNTGARFRLRKTNATGDVYRDWHDIPVFSSTASRNLAIDLSTVGVNTTGSDIATAVVVTLIRDWGATDTLTAAGTTGTPISLHIEDIGPAALFTGAQSIT